MGETDSEGYEVPVQETLMVQEKAKKNYSSWTKEELIEEVKQLKKRKKYGLVWEDKPELVAELCKENLPILTEDKNKEIITDKSRPMNILIEGDNYHALSVLNYTHQGKIDVIYIDPPYNTGAKDWKYNNQFVDYLDSYRHSKWISMMGSRIRLAKNLLQNAGVLICAIDHYELFNLGLLCDEIFGEENRLGVITVVHKPEGRQFANFFSPSNEFMLVYAKNKALAKFKEVVLSQEKKEEFNEEDEKGKFKLQSFIRLTDGKYSLRKNKPAGFYPIYVSSDLMRFSLKKEANYEEIFPITNKGIERVWKTFGDTFMEKVKEGAIVAKKESGKLALYEKLRLSQVLTTHWIDKKYHGYHYGTKLLEEILGGKLFNFPKSLHLLIDILKITANEKAIILDFFAGSGTTGHAVLELNKEDGGNRQFILCTNNENDICTEVCYPRVQKVIRGYKDTNGEQVAGLGGNLKYFKMDFIDWKLTNKNKKNLVDNSTEMLCLKENCFEEFSHGTDFRMFKNHEGKHLGIVYDDEGIEPIKKEIKKINKKFVVYMFSLDESAREEEFEEIDSLVDLKPIPNAIMNVYKRLFK